MNENDKNYYGSITDKIIRPKALGARNGLYCRECKHWWFDGFGNILYYPPCPECGAKNEIKDIIWSSEEEVNVG